MSANKGEESMLRHYKHEIEVLRTKTKEEKPHSFESDICKATGEGKITSAKHLVEQSHADIETKDNDEFTPINGALWNDKL